MMGKGLRGGGVVTGQSYWALPPRKSQIAIKVGDSPAEDGLAEVVEIGLKDLMCLFLGMPSTETGFRNQAGEEEQEEEGAKKGRGKGEKGNAWLQSGSHSKMMFVGDDKIGRISGWMDG